MSTLKFKRYCRRKHGHHKNLAAFAAETNSHILAANNLCNKTRIWPFPFSLLLTVIMKKSLSLFPLLSCAAPLLAQNVGVGTTSPQTRLHVLNVSGASVIRSETSASSADASLELKTNSGTFDFLELRKWMPGATGTLAGIALDGLSQITTGASATGGLLIGTKTAQPLHFTTSNLERMRISGDGRVSIGSLPDGGYIGYMLTISSATDNAIYARSSRPAPGNFTSALVGLTPAGAGNVASVLGAVEGTEFGATSGLMPGKYGVVGTALNEGYGIAAFGTNAGGILSQIMFGSGKALTTIGPVQMSGIGEGAGKVLTSDASGNATWHSLPAGASVWTQNGNNIFNGNSGYVGINTPVALPNYAQLVVQRGAGAGITISGEIGATLSINQALAAGSGVYGITTAPRTGAVGYAGVTGYNIENETDRFGVIGISNGISTGSIYSAGVGGYGYYGVLGYSGIDAGAGIIAQHASGQTALELNNGFLKVSGTNKTAFVHTATAGNTTGHITSLSYTNPSASDIVIATHNYSGTNQYLNKPFGVYWNGSNWTIYLEDATSSILNQAFNVLVIRQ